LKKLTEYPLIYLKGLAMGCADVVPGVSGGTIAFISGIYDRLIHALKAIDRNALALVLRGRLRAAWQQVDGGFLLTVLLGIGTSLFSLAKLMTWLLAVYPIQTWSFFFGLILISAPLILRNMTRWSIGTVVAGLAGVAIAYTITVLTPAQTPTHLPFIFLCGAVAICAMILPGISGAFILLLLGKYEFMIVSLTTLNLPVVVVFIAGCIVGLLSFSHALSWLLRNHRNSTLALLSGFMLGSLNKVWPWKEVIAYRLNHEGRQVPAFDRSVLPETYLNLTGQDPLLFQSILFAAFGVFIIIAIEKIALTLQSKKL
jgi:putative membrane protein